MTFGQPTVIANLMDTDAQKEEKENKIGNRKKQITYMSFNTNIDLNNLPQHIAIIMDGNGRWATQQGKDKIYGHQEGVVSVRECTEAAAEIGVKYLTLYTFSTENWGRPQAEVDALMELLVASIVKETPTLMKNDIRLMGIGDLERLPQNARKNLKECFEKTANNQKMTLILALSYSAKWEIINATQQIAQLVKEGTITPQEIDEKLFEKHLTTKDIPNPDLMIRTSGELRISNFLLWQLAYTEFYFTQKHWPDFRKEALYQAIASYQERNRRFGK